MFENHIVELLPAREELGRSKGGGGNVVLVGLIAQGNFNGQLGVINGNWQSNSIVIVQK
jgi:hypothetical protein